MLHQRRTIIPENSISTHTNNRDQNQITSYAASPNNNTNSNSTFDTYYYDDDDDDINNNNNNNSNINNNSNSNSNSNSDSINVNNNRFNEEEKRRHNEMYEQSCGLAQFFVNPWLFLWIKCQKAKMICSFLCRKCCSYQQFLNFIQTRRSRKRINIGNSRISSTIVCTWNNYNNNGTRFYYYTWINQQKQMIFRHKKLFTLFFLMKSIIFMMILMIYNTPTWNDTLEQLRKKQILYYDMNRSSSSSSSSIIHSTSISTDAQRPITINLYSTHINARKKMSTFKRNKYTQSISSHNNTNNKMVNNNNNNNHHIPNYGGLNITFFSKDDVNFQRTIQDNLNDETNNYTHIYKHYEFQSKTKCEDVSWRHKYQPNCNFFHEIHLDYELYYINSGFYRDVFSFTKKLPQQLQQSEDNMALKVLRPTHNITHETTNEIWTEALVMERLISSPRIMNIYGHCSTTVGTEFVEHEIEKVIVPNGGYIKSNDYQQQQQQQQQSIEDQNNVILLSSQNNLNVTQKLQMALEMALSIADLHGFKDGVIVHDDIQLRQWLRSSDDGRLILGDFNRARIMRWNGIDEKYCKFRTGTVFGDVSYLLSFLLLLKWKHRFVFVSLTLLYIVFFFSPLTKTTFLPFLFI